MDVQDLNQMPWFNPLVEDVRRSLSLRNVEAVDRRPALELKRQQLDERCRGWSQTLSNSKLSTMLRNKIEADYESALERQQEIEALLLESDMQRQRLDILFDPQAVVERLDQLDRILAENNPTLGNLQLAMHIDRIDVFGDGRVVMRTCKVGLLDDAVQLLSDDDIVGSTSTVPNKNHVSPRRRTRLRTEGAENDGEELKNASFFAADPDRFAGLGDEWFWIDEYRIPEATSWAADNAERVFRRRQETRFSYARLAVEFEVTSPTIGAAIRHYLKTHPGEKDEVCLQRGGKRRPKFDLAQFADEARVLWIDGESKEKLAKRYGCSAPTVGKAIAFAYERDGLPMPTRAQARRARVDEARRLLDADRQLDEIAAAMKISDVTARGYLSESFAAEGKPMPDLRRSKPPDAES